MRHSGYELLSHTQVGRIHARRKALGLTPPLLLERFMAALQKEGAATSGGSARMRLARALNPRMRKPMSETTEFALAAALDWTLPEFEQNVLRHQTAQAGHAGPSALGAVALELRRLQDRVEALAATIDLSLASTDAGNRKTVRRQPSTDS